MALQERVEVVGQKDRGNFSPRITIRMRSGEEFSDEFTGGELKWDLATETSRISAIFGEIDWPNSKLDALVQAVSGLDQLGDTSPLIKTCVPD